MKKKSGPEQDPSPLENLEEELSALVGSQKGTSRRNLLKGGAAALAASGLASLLGAKAAEGQSDNPDGGQVPSDTADEEPLDVAYDLSRFEDGPTPSGPDIVDGEDIEITAGDFTRGMTALIGGLKFLDPSIKSGLTDSLARVESFAASGDAAGAEAELDSLRLQVINNADVLDAAAGPFAFGEVTSFSQTIIVLVDYLISLRARIVGVIFIFPWGQIWKIIEVFKQYTVCLTVIQRITFTIYLRLFLFILVVRFQFFPGLRISIDILLLFITICIRVTITRVFRICLTYTRRYLLLVSC